MLNAISPQAREVADKLSGATYTVDQLAAALQCSTRHVWRQIDLDAIPGKLRFGRLVRFSRAVVDSWMAAGCTQAKGAGRG